MIKFVLSLSILTATITFAQNPVAHFPFNGNANDETGVHNLTVNGATLTTDRFGNSNAAYEFDGVDDYLNTSSDTHINLNNEDAITISLWFNSYNVSDGLKTLIARWLSAPKENYGLFVNNDLILGAMKSVSGGHSSSVSITSNSWYHLVGVFDKANLSMKIYLDTSLVINKSNTGGSYEDATDPMDLTIGNNFYTETTPYRFFEGKIDDIHIYNAALTESQIDSLYMLPDPASLGLEENNEVAANIYPNPASNMMTIKSQSKVKEVCVFNVIGEKVAQAKASQTLSIGNLPQGTYMVRINTQNGTTIKKIIKK